MSKDGLLDAIVERVKADIAVGEKNMTALVPKSKEHPKGLAPAKASEAFIKGRIARALAATPESVIHAALSEEIFDAIQ